MPSELGAYLAALAPLLPRRSLALDAGTGDGGLLEVLAPVYERVVGVDCEEAQLARAKERIAARGCDNVTLVEGELDSRRGARRRARGALTRCSRRASCTTRRGREVVAQLAALVRPAARSSSSTTRAHDDESMREQADAWLGFEPAELDASPRAAGLEEPRVARSPGAPSAATGRTSTCPGR